MAHSEQEFVKLKEELEMQTWGLEKTNQGIKLLYKELEQKNEKLKELNKLKSEFVSNVSHEFRTPLACIKESVNIMLEGLLGEINDQQKDFLQTAKSNVDRLARLIEDVLNFQKIESGKMEYFMAEEDISQIIQEACRTMKPLADQKALPLNAIIDNDLPKINIDKDKIIQVLINLINNAVKFTEKGSIEVIVKNEVENIHVLVKDTGMGIEKQDMTRLFQSFEQVGKGKKIKGTGLGLVISQKIIKAHNGKIWAESELDKGTIFHFTLPKKIVY